MVKISTEVSRGYHQEYRRTGAGDCSSQSDQQSGDYSTPDPKAGAICPRLAACLPPQTSLGVRGSFFIVPAMEALGKASARTRNFALLYRYSTRWCHRDRQTEEQGLFLQWIVPKPAVKLIKLIASSVHPLWTHSTGKFSAGYIKATGNSPNANGTFHVTFKDVAFLGSHNVKISSLLYPSISAFLCQH